ncbi:glycosyltransferase [Evansella sp. AB-rgal1]|uniref:CgeB family protein n=1 Tax=Evansella sp. AB-rgal1 TaxID=3242696 RepID=UPI00359D00FD
MKILYISSGYGQIYQSFDLSITKALKQSGNEVKPISPFETDRIIKIIDSFQPDVALILIGFKLPIQIVQLLRSKGVILVVWMTEDPYFIDHSLKLIHHYDYVFSIDLAALHVYKEAGHNHAYHLPLGTDTDIFYPTPCIKDFESDLCLVGYPYPNRLRMIKLLLKETDYSIHLVGSQWKKQFFKTQHPKLSIHPHWITPQNVNFIYNSAKINLNTHRPFNLKQNKNKKGIMPLSINNRTFDIASCRSFQLIECKEDLSQHFNIGKEIICFTSMNDLVDKINYYITHENKREDIAKEGQNKVKSQHTFLHRMNEMIDTICL